MAIDGYVVRVKKPARRFDMSDLYASKDNF